jgi:transcriptional regulator with XRE-family HTH domain
MLKSLASLAAIQRLEHILEVWSKCMASVKLLLQKQSQIKMIQRHRGFTQRTLAKSAYTSDSTVKRFLRGQPISVDNFVHLCEALGIEEWQQYVDWGDKGTNQVVPTPSIFSEAEVASKYSHPKSPICVIAIVSENQKLEIEALLAQRQSLFSTCTNITLPAQGAVVNVSDVVDEHKKLEAEAVQENLKGLLKDCTIIVMPWL